MTATLIGAFLGAVAATVAWMATERSFDVEPLRRTNYRGASLVTSVGVLIPVTVLAVVGVTELASAADDAWYSWSQLSVPTLVAVTGYSLLGLLDDVTGVGQSGGFRGHLATLRRGQLSSGMVKLLGGAALGVVTVGVMQGQTAFLQPDTGSALGLLRDGAIVALAANFGNLFDRAPGRATKVCSLTFAVLALVARQPMLFMPAVTIGAGLGLIVPDLRERAMLGDAGANPLGAVCGIAALWAVPDPSARWLLLLAVLWINLLSEVVSFTKVIDAVAPLRWFDRLGSLRT